MKMNGTVKIEHHDNSDHFSNKSFSPISMCEEFGKFIQPVDEECNDLMV